MRILALNWRDIRNPEAGGAEVHLHEILRHLVEWGHEATMVGSAWPGCKHEEEVDGVRVFRKGHWYDANFSIPLFAKKLLKKEKFDLILEDINKLPFFMPLYTSVPVVPVIPHLFGATAYLETNPLIATYVVLLEKLIPIIFRKNHFMVISPSTKDDLVQRGIDADRISVILCGLDHSKYKFLDIEHFDRPTIVHLGRLRKYKSVDVAIKSMSLIKRSLRNAELVIIGDGPYKDKLEALTHRLGLDDAVEYRGYMEVDKLVEFMNKAHLLINPSPKEGWGLTIVEANACGLPVVASNRPGLKDSVINGKTGFLVQYKDEKAFAEASLKILTNKELWDEMSKNALERVEELTWERCAAESEKFLLEVIDNS